jgi:hypothetical protein
VVHGAFSERLKSTDIARIERTVKERYGVRLRDMNGYQRQCLRLFAEATRLVERLEPLSESKANGNMPSFIAALNAAGRALERFEQAMGQSKQQRNRNDVLTELAKYRGQPGA